jgi:hypothetical protein
MRPAAASPRGRHDEGAGRPALIAVCGPEEDRVVARARREDLEAGGGVLVGACGQSEVGYLDGAGFVDGDLDSCGPALLEASPVP